MVELHGKLDAAFGPGGDPDAGYRISLRESGDFTDALIYDVDSVDVHAPVRTIPFGTPKLIEPPDGGAYAINRTDATLPTPYLPDPLAAGIALRGLPGLVDHVDGDPLTVVTLDDGPLLQIPFEGSWPDLLAPRLRVTEGAGPPRWDADDRVLVVSLPKGEQRRVRVSCYVGEDGLVRNGVWDWIDGGDAPAALRTQAAAGAHWMISPSREIVLVHAVQHPVRTAHFTALVPTRTAIGQTTAELSGTLDLDVASTGRIDVIGEWDDPRDDPTSGVVPNHREAVACDVAVQEGWAEPAPFPPPGGTVQARHEFGDTRHRMVEYRVRATSRFREYMPAGTTDLWRDSDAGERVTVNVLSSARPPAPRVRHAVPTFAWPSPPPAAGWAQHTQERGGGGLRIYLDRPWHASGPGELLAVVMSTVGSQPLPDELRSRYGLDPTTRGVAAPATEPLEPEHFVNRIDEATGLTVAERTGVTATIAAFAPVWDAGRGLWFADVDLAVGMLPWTSWPFVRLALARYQPNALPDAKLSPIAIGEFAQVAPDRRLSLAWQDPSHLAVVLRGRAPAAPHEPRVALRVQTTAAATPDELDWEHASGPPPVIDAPDFFQLVGPSDPDSDGDVSWEAVVELPMPRATAPMRLEVAEYELLRADSEWGRGLPRVTYAAHVPLD
jgi:hypothetical protein